MSKITRKEFVKCLSQPDTMISMTVSQYIYRDEWQKLKAVFNVVGYDKPFDFTECKPCIPQDPVYPGVLFFKGGRWHNSDIGNGTLDYSTRRGVNFEFYQYNDCFLAGEITSDSDVVVARVLRVVGE